MPEIKKKKRKTLVAKLGRVDSLKISNVNFLNILIQKERKNASSM